MRKLRERETDRENKVFANYTLINSWYFVMRWIGLMR